MKKLFLSIGLLASLGIGANAQAPARFNYQGIARTADGAPIAGRAIALRISILDGPADDAAVLYQERIAATTNAHGLYATAIGSGDALVGDMAALDWAAGPRYIRVEIDPDGGKAYEALGQPTQLLSVPYALYANMSGKLAGSSTGEGPIKQATSDYTAGTGIAISPTNAISALNTTALWNANQLQGLAIATTAPTTGQVLRWNGTAWAPFTPIVPTAGTGTTVNATTGAVSVNALLGDVTGPTTATTVAKIQNIAVVTTDPITGQVLRYNGTAWAPATPQTISAGAGTSLTAAGVLSADSSVAIWNANKLQGRAIATTAPAANQVLRYVGATWTPSTIVAPISGTGTTVNAATGAVNVNNLAGDVTGAPNLTKVTKLQGHAVAATVPATNQVLRYNGTSWAPATPQTITAGAGTSLTAAGVLSADSSIAIWNANKLQGKAIATTAPINGQSLVYNTATAAWTPTTLGTGGAVTLTGDVTGSSTATTVAKLQNIAVSTTDPTADQVLRYNGTAWAPATLAIPAVAGTVNRIPVFTAASTLTNSRLVDTTVGLLYNTTKSTVPGSIFETAAAIFNSPIQTPTDGRTGFAFLGHGGGTYLHVADSTDGFKGVFLERANGVPGALASFGYTPSNDRISISGSSIYGLYMNASNGKMTNYSLPGNANPTIASPYDTAGYFTSNSSNNLSNGILRAEYTGTAINDHVAIYGRSKPDAAFNYGIGVVGEGGYIGVRGTATTTSANGVIAISGAGTSNGDAYGLFASANDPDAIAGGIKYGVYAAANGGTTDYAGYFAGNLYASSASAGVKAFKIDDPRDPANKFLYHSSVESPDMMNIYNGNATTDAQGFATITLPDYFEVLNGEYRYQLTVVDASDDFVMAKVVKKVSGNQFTIRSSKPGVEVSWQVTGVRHDPVANAYRIQTSVDKNAAERGQYLNPEVYGQPASKGFGYQDPHQHDAQNNRSHVPQQPVRAAKRTGAPSPKQ